MICRVCASSVPNGSSIQKDFRIADQHLRKTDALALPARQHMRIAFGETAKADALQPILRARLAPRSTACRAVSRPIGDILDRGLPRKQRIGLEQIT